MKRLVYSLLCALSLFASQAIAMSREGLRREIDKHEKEIQDLANFAQEVLGDENQNPDPQLVAVLNYRKEPINAQIRATLENIKVTPCEQREANVQSLRCQGLLKRLKDMRFGNGGGKNPAPKQNADAKNKAKKEKEERTKPAAPKQNDAKRDKETKEKEEARRLPTAPTYAQRRRDEIKREEAKRKDSDEARRQNVARLQEKINDHLSGAEEELRVEKQRLKKLEEEAETRRAQDKKLKRPGKRPEESKLAEPRLK